MERKKIKKSSLVLLTLLLVAMSSFTAFAVETVTINYKVARPAATYVIGTDSKNVNSRMAALSVLTDATQGTTDYYLYANGSTKGVISSHLGANNTSAIIWYVDYASHGYANYTGNVEVRVRSTCEVPFTISGVFIANYQ